MNNSLPLGALLVTTLFLGSGCERNAAITQAPGGASHVIAVIPKTTNMVFWQSVRSGAEAAGKEFGFEIAWDGPERETNNARQVQAIENALARHVEGVVLAPVDRSALVASVDKLAALNVPCAIIDSGLNSVQFLCYVSTDNYQAGAVAARRMGETLGGKGNVLVVMHIPGSLSTSKRVNGFTDTLASEFPEIKVVFTENDQDSVEMAKQVTEQMLAQNPDLQGLFACNITTSLGAFQALQAQRRVQVKMVAFDPDRTLLDGLRSGQIDAIVLQNPYKMGYEGVKAVALKLTKGQTGPRFIDTGIEVVTSISLTDPIILRLLGLQQ